MSVLHNTSERERKIGQCHQNSRSLHFSSVCEFIYFTLNEINKIFEKNNIEYIATFPED